MMNVIAGIARLATMSIKNTRRQGNLSLASAKAAGMEAVRHIVEDSAI
jgi:hypothetical protein